MNETLDDFREFCAELTLDTGGPMELEPFQRLMLADYFDGARETLIMLPKKNGKTTLLASLALFHLLTTPDAACFIAAASRDQATLLYDFARGFVDRSESLQGQVVVKRGYRELWAAEGDGRIRVLAADVDTADGVLPTLGLVDELHRHKSADLYGIFRDGLGPRQGQMITISTAGDDEESPLGRLRSAAYSLPGFKRDGAHNHVRADGFAMHEWCLVADDDRGDLELVKQANPATWQTIEELRRRADSPSMTPWAWARFACGVWLAGEQGAISEIEWRACGRAGLQIPAGTPGVFIGVDLGWRQDTTAIVPVWRADPDSPVQVHAPVIVEPPGDGTSTLEDAIFDPIEEMAERWPEATIILDPAAGGEQLAQRLERELEVQVATHSQKVGPMALAAQRLSEAIAAGRIQHPDDEGLNRHVLAAAAKPVGEGWRLVKPRKSDAKIDAAIALAMAHSTLIGTKQRSKRLVAFR